MCLCSVRGAQRLTEFGFAHLYTVTLEYLFVLLSSNLLTFDSPAAMVA